MDSQVTSNIPPSQYTHKATLASLVLDPELAKIAPEHSPQELKQMEQSILINGIEEPLIIDSNTRIVADGMTRFKFAMRYNFETVPIVERKFLNKLDIKRFVIENVISRRHLNDFQKIRLGMMLLPIEKELAKLRQGRQLRSNDHKGPTRDLVAHTVGVSAKTFDRGRTVLEKAPKAVIEKVEHGKMSITKAYTTVMINENQKHLKPSQLPNGIWNFILWDPGWPYKNTGTGGSGTSGADVQYMTEAIEKMCNNPIKNVIAKDAILAMWTLPTFHAEALKVVMAMGMQVIRTKLYWDKMVPKQGYNYRNQVEELLICTKGKVRAFHMVNQRNLIPAKSGKHSEKPEIFYQILEESARRGLGHTTINKIELNARKQRPGWTCVGNQLYCPKCNQFHIDHNCGPDSCECKCHNHIVIEIKFTPGAYQYRLIDHGVRKKIQRGTCNASQRSRVTDALLKATRKEFADRSVISKVLQ